ncbi:hypothetical protein SAMN05216276_102250, partial [Streptosporangium subroseum]
DDEEPLDDEEDLSDEEPPARRAKARSGARRESASSSTRPVRRVRR